MKHGKIQQKQFDKLILRSERKSQKNFRGQLYQRALDLIDAGHEVEAYLLILATWNIADFRRRMKKFNLHRFCDTIDKSKHHFRQLAGYSFPTADFDTIAKHVAAIYNMFDSVVGQVGASKLIHLTHPSLFVMWDTKIRHHYGFKKQHCNARAYIAFQKRMKSEFGSLTWLRKDKTFARAVDEYNMTKITNVTRN